MRSIRRGAACWRRAALLWRWRTREPDESCGARLDANAVKLPKLLAPAENEAEPPPEPQPPGKRVGFAIVGLGHLALEQILPAFGESRHCRPVALVSRDRNKAMTVASRHGIDSRLDQGAAT